MSEFQLNTTAKILTTTEVDVQEAAQYLREGKLVAFPTETVYGLGANAFDEKAIRSIFAAKGRPLTDPLIVHVPSLAAANKLTNINEDETRLFNFLGTSLWPGPLTMIVRAVDTLPLCVTANTGFVGLRIPDHALATRLLEACKLPIAAPSANRFGHVSPTKASHVYDDLGIGRGVTAVLSGDDTDNAVSTCLHGIESTVMKADVNTHEVLVYRQGAISRTQLQTLLDKPESLLQLNGVQWTVRVVNKTVHMSSTDAPVSIDEVKVGQEAPGQAVTHYAPDNGVCILSDVVDLRSLLPNGCNHDSSEPTAVSDKDTLIPWNLSATDLSTTVIIDFRQQWKSVLSQLPGSVTVLALRDLSPLGSYTEAARQLFDALRWAESVPGVRTIILTPVLQDMCVLGECNTTKTAVVHDSTLSDNYDIKYGVYDRQFRAASGKLVLLKCV